MTTLVHDLQSYQDKRRFSNWEPVPAGIDKRIPLETLEDKIATEIVHRCLDFISLEFTVGEWVTTADISEEARLYLARNAKDEDKHARALEMLAHYYDYKKPPTAGIALVKMWQNLGGNLLLNAYALEMGVFFSILPTLNKYGDVYASTIAGWINDDERIHVESNLRIMRELGLKLNREHAVAVARTVQYIYGPLGETIAKAQAERAVKRLLTAKDSAMAQESVPVTIAFFEQATKKAIVY